MMYFLTNPSTLAEQVMHHWSASGHCKAKVGLQEKFILFYRFRLMSEQESATSVNISPRAESTLTAPAHCAWVLINTELDVSGTK